MCRMSAPSGRFHDVTFAPCIFTCNCANSIKQHRSAQHILPLMPDRGMASPACPKAKKGACHLMSCICLKHLMCSQCSHVGDH